MSIIQSNGIYKAVDVTATYPKLPVGNYLLKFNMEDGFYLTKKEDFTLPKKIYGDTSIVDRWARSYMDNTSKNLGIILSGIKGSGKTITAQQFCLKMKKPVIIVNEAFGGPEFVDFLTRKEFDGSIIFLDEFEKIYDRQNEDKQQYFLSLMDGAFNTNLIFVLTCNEYRINSYLINRLNRIKYRKHYINLEQSVIDEVVNDLLINKTHKDSINEFFDIIGLRTFDLLVNLINEMNSFNENAIECAKHLNLEAEEKYYEVYEIFRGKEYLCYNASFKKTNKDITVNRKTTRYLLDFYKANAKQLVSVLEDEDDIMNYEEDLNNTSKDQLERTVYNYIPETVELTLNECIIHKINEESINIFN